MRLHAATIPAEALAVRPRDAYYARQKRLFALAFVVVAVLPLLLLERNASRFYRESWLERTSLELAGMARDRRQLVDLFLRGLEAQLAGLTAAHEAAEAAARVDALFAAVNASGFIADLGVVDREGRHLGYAGPFRRELAGRNYREASWFAEALRTGRHVSDVFPGYRRVPHLVVAVADARREWILRATVDSAFFDGLVSSAEVGPGGDAFLVNRGGELQTPSRHGHERVPPDELARLAALADAGRTGDLDGSLRAAAWVNGGAWLLVLENDVAASLAAFQRARRRHAILIAAAAAAVVLVAVLVTRSMVGGLARAERERQAMADRVREVEKMALVGRLAASVSHEVNNPLQVISEHSALLDELLDDAAAGRPDLDACRRSVGRIRDHVRRAAGITRRLLGFARAPGPERAPADPNRTVEETVALLEGEARRHGIAIVRDYQPDLAPVVTDAVQLQQVFLNVLGNAIDAIGERGEIRVSTRDEAGALLVSFQDTGPGLSDEARGRIFEPFFTTKRSGTGLGLYVSHAIAERLGGELSAANRPEGGCAFTVRIPAGQAPAAFAAGRTITREEGRTT